MHEIEGYGSIDVKEDKEVDNGWIESNVLKHVIKQDEKPYIPIQTIKLRCDAENI